MRSRLSSLVLVLLAPVVVSAQGVPVYDNANWLANIVTSAQSILIQLNQLVELLPLEELVAMDGFAEDLDAMREVLQDLRGLGWDVRSLDSQFEHLFGLPGLPESSAGLAAWQIETRQAVRDARYDAMRTQTLIRTLRRTFEHLLGLMDTMANALGNLQISQTVSQAQQKVAQLLSEQQITRTVHERAETLQALSDQSETEILNKINCGLWKNWPGMECD